MPVRAFLRLLAIVVTLGLSVLAMLPTGRGLEDDLGLRALYSLRGPIDPGAGALVVSLDSASVQWLQRNADQLLDVGRHTDGCLTEDAIQRLSEARNVGTIPRGVHRCLLRLLAQRDAALIAFDVSFNATKAEDALLAQAIREAGTVLLYDKIVTVPNAPDGVFTRARPTEVLRDAALETVHFQTNGGPNRVVTAYAPLHRSFPRLKSMPYAAWQRRAGKAIPPPDQVLQPVWFYGGPQTVPTVSLRDIFDAAATDPLPANLSQTVVFIGTSDPAVTNAGDHFVMPVGWDRPLTGGVEVAATSFLNLMHGDSLGRLPPGVDALISLVVTGSMVLIAVAIPSLRGLLMVLGISAATVATASAAFTLGGLWGPIAIPIGIGLPAALAIMLGTRYTRARRAVGQLAPAPIGEALIAAGNDLSEVRREEAATIIFIDLAGSTRLGELMGASSFHRVMDIYYENAAAALTAENGMIIEFKGDGILAILTSSVAGPDHAARGVRAVRAASRAVHRAGEAQMPEAFAKLQMRIGVHSGFASIGAVGSRDRYNFNAIGDAVNVAARLEDYGRAYQTEDVDVIVISEATFTAAGLSDSDAIALGPVSLRGRQDPISLYRIESGLTPRGTA